MKCNPLLKAAFEGIELSYKLDRIMAELPKTAEFNSETINSYLIKKGVSPKEIKASGILNMYKGDYKFPASEWQADFKKLGDRHHINKINVTETGKAEGYDNVTLGTKGDGNPTYKETLYQSKKIPKAPENVRHYPEYNGGNKSILGWNRTHIDKINDKDTTVLNEFQSDWAQTERSGAGRFKSTTDESIKSKIAAIDKQIEDKYGKTTAELYKEKPVEWIKAQPLFRNRTRVGLLEEDPIVADFPMSEKAHTQLQIIDTINQSIKNGTNRIAIPIERENELVGTRGVTKFYDNLNKKILPDIKKKLEKQGLKLKLSKETYMSNPTYKERIDSVLNRELDEEPFENLLDDLDNIFSKAGTDYIKVMEENGYNYEELISLAKEHGVLDEVYKAIENNIPKVPSNTLHIIEIEEIPGHPVNWDVYQMLGAIGLGGLADKLKEEDKKQ